MLLALLLLACGTPAPVPSPQATLDALDTRQPLPLLPPMALHQKAQMRGHLEAVQQVMEALATEDWEAVEAAAARIGTSPRMTMTCEHMGAAADGFTEQALDFHQRADAIVEAARAHDGAAVLRSTAHTVQACTACHAAWRQQVVDPEAYEALGGTVPEHLR